MKLAKRKLRLEGANMLKQTTLDGALRTATDHVPFTRTAFHQALINFIVADDQSINVIECWEFRDLILLLRSDLDDKDIPHHTRIRESIIQSWEAYFKELKVDLGVRAILFSLRCN